jgi:uncharacterized protein YecT (DUF1311 family)
MKKSIFFVLINCFLSVMCFAQTQAEMNILANKDYKAADAKMAKIYKKVLNSLTNASDKKLLLEAQRAWIKYKETHCKLVANAYKGGSIQPLIYANCLTSITEARIKALEELIEEK